MSGDNPSSTMFAASGDLGSVAVGTGSVLATYSVAGAVAGVEDGDMLSVEELDEINRIEAAAEKVIESVLANREYVRRACEKAVEGLE